MNALALRLASRLFDRPIIQNQYRSVFVEAMIEPYLAPAGWRHAGDDWGGWDFERNDGARLELKQSSAQQTWSQARQIRTRGSFDIAPRTGYFYEGGTKFSETPGRPAHLYVFAWNESFGEATDHRDPSQWRFFVVPARLLPDGQKSIALSRIKNLAGPTNPINIEELAGEIDRHLPR